MLLRRVTRFARFLLCGATAALAHFATLAALVNLARVDYVGVANMIAAVVGLTTSYFGNRHFVFFAAKEPPRPQAVRFAIVYVSVAVLHGAVLFAWTDMLGYDYKIGFLIAAALSTVVTYVSNRDFVFLSARPLDAPAQTAGW